MLQAKISKRGRKLIDYDVARHNFDTMTAKRVDQAKLSKVGSLFYLQRAVLCVVWYISEFAVINHNVQGRVTGTDLTITVDTLF